MSIDDGRVVLAAFLATSVLGGVNAVAVRFSNRELDPLWGAGLRFSLAAALVPLATLLLAVLQRQERFRVIALVGAIVGLGGIVVMSRTSLPESVPLLSLLAAVASALCVAQAAVFLRFFPRAHPVTMNALGMATGAVLLLAGSLLAGELHPLPRDGETLAALVYLIVVGSVLVFVLYLFVLARWSASRTTYGLLIIPVVTVALSAWLDDEKVGLGLVLGGVLVLAGVYVGALRPVHGPR
ncbi:hypothetical protein BH18ACT13_BH18ACT13_13420 [soil metagenome]